MYVHIISINHRICVEHILGKLPAGGRPVAGAPRSLRENRCITK